MEKITIGKSKVRRSGGHALTFNVPTAWLQARDIMPGEQVYAAVDAINKRVTYYPRAKAWTKAFKLRIINNRPVLTISKEYAFQADISEGDEVEITMTADDLILEVQKVGA